MAEIIIERFSFIRQDQTGKKGQMVNSSKNDKQALSRSTDGALGGVMLQWRRERDLYSARWRRQGIAFLLEVSQLDANEVLNGSRPGDLLNLCAGLSKLCWPAQVTDGTEEEKVSKWAQLLRKPDVLAAIIDKLNGLFTAVADDDEAFNFPLEPTSSLIFDARALRAGRRPFSSLISPDTKHGLVQAVVHSAFVLLSEDTQGLMVQRCKREKCRGPRKAPRIFLAKRVGQDYCSRKCANAAAFDHYKETLGPEAFRAKRRVKTATISEKPRVREIGAEASPRTPSKAMAVNIGNGRITA